MRQQYDPLKAEELRGQIRLALVDVEPGAGDRAGGQRLDQRALIDSGSPPDVDQIAVRPERPEDRASTSPLVAGVPGRTQIRTSLSRASSSASAWYVRPHPASATTSW